jgi:hypothetical protein|tara:strand:+ start:3642 stop:3797 length:156 start_codon:yes stop_codon:yes gene_type:complete
MMAVAQALIAGASEKALIVRKLVSAHRRAIVDFQGAHVPSTRWMVNLLVEP